VRELSKTGAEALTGVPGATLHVGGIPALNADYQTIVNDRFVSVTALVVVATLWRFSAASAPSSPPSRPSCSTCSPSRPPSERLVLVFQDGHGSSLLGVPGGTGSVFPLVPIVTFAIVFGLSMDYEVFLVARVLEARRSG
jgi:RND superfamily putative drug exporter